MHDQKEDVATNWHAHSAILVPAKTRQKRSWAFSLPSVQCCIRKSANEKSSIDLLKTTSAFGLQSRLVSWTDRADSSSVCFRTCLWRWNDLTGSPRSLLMTS